MNNEGRITELEEKVETLESELSTAKSDASSAKLRVAILAETLITLIEAGSKGLSPAHKAGLLHDLQDLT